MSLNRILYDGWDERHNAWRYPICILTILLRHPLWNSTAATGSETLKSYY